MSSTIFSPLGLLLTPEQKSHANDIVKEAALIEVQSGRRPNIALVPESWMPECEILGIKVLHCPDDLSVVIRGKIAFIYEPSMVTVSPVEPE